MTTYRVTVNVYLDEATEEDVYRTLDTTYYGRMLVAKTEVLNIERLR